MKLQWHITLTNRKKYQLYKIKKNFLLIFTHNNFLIILHRFTLYNVLNKIKIKIKQYENWGYWHWNLLLSPFEPHCCRHYKSFLWKKKETVVIWLEISEKLYWKRRWRTRKKPEKMETALNIVEEEKHVKKKP